MLDVRVHALIISHMLVHQWQIAKRKSLYAWLPNILPCLIIWNIWIARNKAKYEDMEMNHWNIIKSIRL